MLVSLGFQREHYNEVAVYLAIIIIYYENCTRGTQEIIKLDITESLQMKQKVHSANSEHQKLKSLKKVHR